MKKIGYPSINFIGKEVTGIRLIGGNFEIIKSATFNLDTSEEKEYFIIGSPHFVKVKSGANNDDTLIVEIEAVEKIPERILNALRILQSVTYSKEEYEKAQKIWDDVIENLKNQEEAICITVMIENLFMSQIELINASLKSDLTECWDKSIHIKLNGDKSNINIICNNLDLLNCFTTNINSKYKPDSIFSIVNDNISKIYTNKINSLNLDLKSKIFDIRPIEEEFMINEANINIENTELFIKGKIKKLKLNKKGDNLILFDRLSFEDRILNFFKLF